MNRRPLMLMLAPLALLGGCLGEPPSVDLTGAAPGESTDQALAMTLTFTGANDDETPLPLKEADYTVTLEGPTPLQCSFSQVPQAVFPAFGKQAFTVPAVFALPPGAKAPAGPVPFHVTGTLWYTAPGHIPQILYDYHLSRPSVDFAGDGMVTFTLAAPPPGPVVAPAAPASGGPSSPAAPSALGGR